MPFFPRDVKEENDRLTFTLRYRRPFLTKDDQDNTIDVGMITVSKPYVANLKNAVRDAVQANKAVMIAFLLDEMEQGR